MALASKEGKELATKPLPPATAQEMLGCYAEPQGASKASLEHAAKLAVKRAAAACSSGLGHSCAWQHCNGTYFPSVAYSFAVRSIKEAKLEKLQSRVAHCGQLYAFVYMSQESVNGRHAHHSYSVFVAVTSASSSL